MSLFAGRVSPGRATRLLARVTLCLAIAAPLAAQSTGTIRGRVTEAGSQRGISDVQVSVTGTTSGGLTNANGDYVIAAVPAGAREVSVRRIGYARRAQQVTVPAGSTVTANFEIQVAASQLDAVVVTGTGGAAEKRTLGNSITTLDVADLTSKTTVTNVMEVLQAKSPGVTILPGSGAPGTAGEIRIRGSSSLSGYKPVVFIDGLRYNIDDLGGFSATGGGTAGLAQSTQVTSALNNLNPNDIESIEIIKGPAAATLYGADAANGVIQIITKKGIRGQQRMRWNVRAEAGVSEWTRLPDDNYTTCDAAKVALRETTTNLPVWKGCFTWNADSTQFEQLPINTILTENPIRDWRSASGDQAIRAGNAAKLSMNLRGGGDRFSYYLAADRDTEQGVYRNSENNRSSIRTNFGFDPSDKSSIQLNVNYQQGRLRLPIQDESVNGILLSATRGQPGRASVVGSGNAGWRTISPASANRYKNFTEDERLTLGSTINYNPFEWFQNRLTLGFDNTNTQAQLLFLPGEIDASQDPDAASGANLRRTPMRRLLTFDYAGTLRWTVMNRLDAETKFGTQVVADRSETLRATGIGIGAVDVTRIDLLQRTSGAEDFSENNSVGYYLQEQLGWANRLFVTGALRADDHSSFGTNFDWIIYPKFSVSYVVSDEPGMKSRLESARITSLKLRGAWGQAGRAPSAFSAPQTYTPDRVIIGTGSVSSALRTASYGNPDLKPERGEEIELGFDLGMLNERLGVDFTFYDKKTKDLLQTVSVPASTGFVSTQLRNLGQVTNRGIEVSLFGTPMQTTNFTWDTRLNVSTNMNRLDSFGIVIPGRIAENPGGQTYGVVQQHREGFPLGGYWVTPPQRDANGVAILTPAGAAIFNAGDTARRYIGTPAPTREIGFSNTFTIMRGLRFYALFDYKGGHHLFNQQERSRCQTANDNCARTNNPRARFPQNAADSVLFKELAVYRHASGITPEWIQKADFVKLRELSLTFDVPQRFLRRSGASAASIMLSGRNLALWTDYEGNDPEVNSYGGRNFVRVDAYAAPPTRRLVAAINLSY